LRILFLFFLLTFTLEANFKIIQAPIIFDKTRVELTKEYIKHHYGLNVKDITIVPKSIVLHWTAILNFKYCYNLFNSEAICEDRADLKKASSLNVSAHYLVKRDGTIYQLMPDNWMARHVIGLNYSSIGIENIGGYKNINEDLTQQQIEANVWLINYLKRKYPTIEYLLGHYEYKRMKKTPLWLEKDKSYITYKKDPGKKFMFEVRKRVKKLNLKEPPL